MEQSHEYRWGITKIVAETPLVSSLYLRAAATPPPFIAGQYLTVKLPSMGPTEGKPYSISSAPHESLVRVSIKRIGAFSEALLALQVGDELVTSAPYGFFYPERDDRTPLVFIAGGIGITPCLSIIKDLAHANDPRPLALHYSNQTAAEITFHRELEDLAASHGTLTVRYYLTREQPADTTMTAGRISARALCASAVADISTEFFICGSMNFTKDVWKALRSEGIELHRLYTEGFF